MFRRKQTPSAPEQREAIGIDLTELAALERALLEADRLRRTWISSGPPPPFFGMDLHTTQDVIAELYRRAGAASVVQPDPQRVRVPLYRHEFLG